MKRILLKQALHGLGSTRKQRTASCDGNGQKRVVDYLRAKGQYPVRWDQGHTVTREGWWRRETSSGVFLRNPTTGETFVERVTVSDCPTCSNNVEPANLLFEAPPLPLDQSIEAKTIDFMANYETPAEAGDDDTGYYYGDIWGIPFDGRDIPCNVEKCLQVPLSDLPVINQNFMKVWAHTNQVEKYDTVPEILSASDWQRINQTLSSLPAGECTTITIEKDLIPPSTWTRDRSKMGKGCEAIAAGTYVYTFIHSGDFETRDQFGTAVQNCIVVFVVTRVPGESGLTYVMPGSKYRAFNGEIDYCDPINLVPPIFDDPSQPDNPNDPPFTDKPPRTGPPSGDCPCKDLLVRAGLKGLGNDPEVEYLFDGWY